MDWDIFVTSLDNAERDALRAALLSHRKAHATVYPLTPAELQVARTDRIAAMKMLRDRIGWNYSLLDAKESVERALVVVGA